MPRIVRAEFLSYTDARRNSDKLFNVFVIEDEDGTYRAISEYGRRGNNLVRDTLCAKATREFADSQMRHKLFAKRNHRETPYTDEPFGFNYSGLVREYGYNSRTENAPLNSKRAVEPTTKNVSSKKASVIEFPAAQKETPRREPKLMGIINQEQFDSLEI
jgi:hypothetical protein